MKHFVTSITILIFSFNFLQAQSESISPLAKKIQELSNSGIQPVQFYPFTISENPNTFNEIIKAAEYFTLRESDLMDITQNHYGFIEVTIPFNGNLVIVQLTEAIIFSADFEVRTSNNEMVSYDKGAHYRGIIKNDNNSLVSMSFFKDHIQAIISSKNDGNIVISPLKNSLIHTIYNDSDLLIANPFNCKTTDENFNTNIDIQHDEVVGIDPCLKIYIEADYEMFQDEGGAIQAADFIVGFFSVASTLYFNEEITIIISEIFIWVTPDPYPNSSSLDALEYFRDYRTTFDGNLAHLVTYDEENLGGIAYKPGLCSSYKYAFTNIYDDYNDFPTYSWTVYAFTHEIGHNIGSSHTQSCDWPGGAIDNCVDPEGPCSPGPTPPDGGTIMSYCHLTPVGINFLNGFGPLPGNLIRDEYNDAGCLGDCDLPPTNDWPCDATIIPVNGECVFTVASNVGAINSVVTDVVCDGTSEGDVWFKVTMPPLGYFIIDTDNGPVINNMGMKVYSGNCASLVSYPDGCISDGSTYAPLMPGITITGTPGVNYYLRVWEVGNDAFGNFSICAYTDCASSYPADEINASDPLICAGENTTLTVEGGALGEGGEWNWYTGSCAGAPIGTGESIVVNPLVATTYYVKVIGDCNTTSCVSKTINVHPQPETPIITFEDCFLSVEFIDGLTYNWYLNGTLIPDENENILTVTENGDYVATVTNANGCTATSLLLPVTCQGLNVNDFANAEITIYPNPANGKFTININGINGEIPVTISTVTGQVINKQITKISMINNKITYDLQLAAGLYFVQIGEAGSSITKKLVIE